MTLHVIQGGRQQNTDVDTGNPGATGLTYSHL